MKTSPRYADDARRRLGTTGWLWKAFLIAGLAMAAGYFLLPSQDIQTIAYQVPGGIAAMVVAAGAAIHRPAKWPLWVLLALGLALTSAGDWTWVVLEALGEEPFPSVADVLYLGGFGLQAAAILLLVRGRIPGGDRAGLLDALIATVGIGLVSWVFLMQPIVADPESSLVEIAVALAYPLLDILLLGVMVRLFLFPGRYGPTLTLLIGGLVSLLLADFPYAFLALTDSYHTGHPIEVGWLVSPILWGAAALHPSMRETTQPVERGEVPFSAWRLLLLAGASLMAPALLIMQWATGASIDVPVIAAGTILLYLLVIARLAGVVSDLRTTLRQRRALERELERRALHDPLTGLANRTLFAERLDAALAGDASEVAVLFLDLDDFKTVNDAYGHHAGDDLLRTVATALSRAVRPSDVVARLGGDEFAVLLERDIDAYEAGKVADRLLDAVLNTPSVVAGAEHSLGASIGISMGVPGASAAETLMQEADIAMYVSKSKGKGGFTVFETTTHAEVVRGLELRTDLDRAIREEQFELHYQPMIELATGDVAGVEALVRWRHPERGLLPPMDFIPLAEATGAIVPLGRWILEQACRQAVAWRVSLLAAPQSRMAVNLSALQLAHPEFVPFVVELLHKTGLPAEQLMLEVTESTRLDQEAAGVALRELRELGVRLAVDDFGTGYASLSQLARSPFETVKIDQSFIAAMTSSPRADALVTGVVDLARRLGVTVVAEGIESAVQAAELRRMGCALGQGFHLAAPMRPADLEAELVAMPEPTTTPGAARPGLRPATDMGGR